MLNITGLTTYVNQNSGSLITKAVATGKTVSIATIQPGIKGAATVNTLTNNLVLQAGACGFTDAGSTILAQRTLTVEPIKLNESICLTDLEDTFLSLSMSAGSYNTEMPVEEIFVESKVDGLKAEIEKMIWRGNKTTGTGNLALVDGLVKMFTAEVSGANLGAYTIATLPTTIIDKVDEAISKLPEALVELNDLTLFMSPADFRTYTLALRNANLYHYAANATNGMIVAPASNVTVVSTPGLTGTNRWVLTPASNIVIGTDLLSDADNMKIFYSEDNDRVQVIAKFKLGVQVAFIDNVVYYVGA